MKDHFPPEKTDNFEVMSYPKAGHIIEPPYSPLTRMSYHKTWGKSTVFIHILNDTSNVTDSVLLYFNNG